MSVPSKTLTYNDLNTFCKQTFDKTFIQEVWDDTPFMAWLWANRETDNWGPFITNPVQYQNGTANVNLMSNTAWDTTTYIDDSIATVAQWEPYIYTATAALKFQDEVRNKGRAEIVSWIDAKYTYLQDKVKQYVAQEFFTGTTGFIGLTTAIATTPTNTYAGIDRSDANYTTAWANQATNKATSGGLGGLILGDLESLFLDCSAGTSKYPDFIVTTERVFKKLWNIVDARQRVHDWKPSGSVSTGWKAIDFNGIPIVYDRKCPTGYLYMLNSKWVKLRTYPETDMTVTPWKELETQDGKGKKCYVGGQLCVLAPNRMGVLYGIT